MLLPSTSPTTADRLIKCKLMDLCMIEICYCIHNFFGKGSTFSIYHDESTDYGISFLPTLLSFNPVFHNHDGLFKPELLNKLLCKAICSHPISDKTAESAVKQAILPSLITVNEMGHKLYGASWIDLFSLLKKHLNGMSDENTTAIATTKLLLKVCL